MVLGSRSPPALVPARGSTSVWAALLGSRLPVVSRGPPPGLPLTPPCHHPAPAVTARQPPLPRMGTRKAKGQRRGLQVETLDQNNQPGSGALPCCAVAAPGSWHGRHLQDGARYSPASGKGAARDLFSLLLHSPTTLCRTLRCYGRKRKPDVWPSWPGRGERLRRHCQWAGEAPAHHPGSPHTPPKCFTCVNMLLWPQI